MLRSPQASRTEPSDEPVDVEDVRRQVGWWDTERDADLRELITTARREAEEALGTCCLNQTCVDVFDAFADEMQLHWAPISSITSIGYVDRDGADQTLATSVYECKTQHGLGVVQLKYNQSWPTTRGHTREVTITYVAGYGSVSTDVPEGVRRWIRTRAAWYAMNSDGGPGMEWSPRLNNLLSPHAVGAGRVIA